MGHIDGAATWQLLMKSSSDGFVAISATSSDCMASVTCGIDF